METALQEYKADLMEVSDTPQEMAIRLSGMKQKLTIVQQFFKEVMVDTQDYGIIPGTDKPSLYKAGAEKLNELYGFAPTVKDVDEESNTDTGYYRARVTVALVHRKTGMIVAEGVGEANTRESRYRYRWLSDWKVPKEIDKSTLHSEVRKKKKKDGKGYDEYVMYRMENDDPWTLWNTILKMAKKRALVDATLSATRSSGIFTQDTEDLKGWIAEAERDDTGTKAPEQRPSGQRDSRRKKDPQPPDDQTDMKATFAAITDFCKQHPNYDQEIFTNLVKDFLRASYKVDSLSILTVIQWKGIHKNIETLIQKVEAKYVEEMFAGGDMEEEPPGEPEMEYLPPEE